MNHKLIVTQFICNLIQRLQPKIPLKSDALNPLWLNESNNSQMVMIDSTKLICWDSDAFRSLEEIATIHRPFKIASQCKQLSHLLIIIRVWMSTLQKITERRIQLFFKGKLSHKWEIADHWMKNWTLKWGRMWREILDRKCSKTSLKTILIDLRSIGLVALWERRQILQIQSQWLWTKIPCQFSIARQAKLK